MISKKKIKQIDAVSFALEAFESVAPKNAGHDPWWESQPDMWRDDQRELWDLVFENERKVKEEILRILGVTEN
jgi:hypothetical protein